MKQSSQQGILILLCIALFAVFNILASEIVQRFQLKLDLTDSSLYEMSDPTQRFLQAVEDDITITVFNSKQDYPHMLREVLSRFTSLNTNIAIRYRDPFRNPVLVDSFQQRGVRIDTDDLILESEESFRRLSIEDLYIFNSDKSRITGLKAEQALCSAIIQLSSDTRSFVRFSDGHSEQVPSSLEALFKDKSYQVEKISLSVSSIDGDTDLFVIAAPLRDFSGNEIQKLERYLSQGGKLMVFLPPSAKTLQNLEGLLKEWGIGFEDELVYEPKAHISDNPLNIVPMYAQHPINSFFGENRIFLLSPSSRRLSPIKHGIYDLDVMTVLASSGESYVKNSRGERVNGPFHLALSASRPTASGEKSSRIFACGSSKIIADDILSMGSFANADFLTQVTNWLDPDRLSVHIPPKKIGPDPLSILPSRAAFFGILLGLALPLGILICGVVVNLKRKKNS